MFILEYSLLHQIKVALSQGYTAPIKNITESYCPSKPAWNN
jgi:hypothetical protein